MIRFGTDGPVTGLAFAPDGLLAVADRAGAGRPWLRLYNTHTGRTARTVAPLPDQSPAVELTASSCGRWLASRHDPTLADAFAGAADRRVVRVWEADTGELLYELRSSSLPVFDSTGRLVIALGSRHDSDAARSGQRPWLREAATGRGLSVSLPAVGIVPPGRPVLATGFAPDGSVVVVEDRAVRRFGLPHGTELPPVRVVVPPVRGYTPVLVPGRLTAAGFVGLWHLTSLLWPNRTEVVTVYLDSGVARACGRVSAWGDPMPVSRATDPDGTRLAVVAGRLVRMWDLTAGSERRRFDPGLGPLAAVAFSADGLLAAAGGRDGVAVWDVDG